MADEQHGDNSTHQSLRKLSGAVFGNGRDGLMTRVAMIESSVRGIKSDTEAMRTTVRNGIVSFAVLILGGFLVAKYTSGLDHGTREMLDDTNTRITEIAEAIKTKGVQ